MSWKIVWEKGATKNLLALDYPVQKKILSYLSVRVTRDPRSYGRELVGSYSWLWRYRVEDFRIVCRIESEQVRVLVLRVGHRREIYE